MYNVRECMSCLIVNIIIEGSSVCHCSRVRVFVIVQQPQFLQANYQLWDKPSMANLFLDEHGVALMMRHGAPQLITVIILYLCVQCPYPISFPPFPPRIPSAMAVLWRAMMFSTSSSLCLRNQPVSLLQLPTALYATSRLPRGTRPKSRYSGTK